MTNQQDFGGTMGFLAGQLLQTTPFMVGEWQSKDVSKVRQYDTYEIVDASIRFDIPETSGSLANYMAPYVNLAWAEEHFQERVGGKPVNPPPSHQRWPWARHNGQHQNNETHVFAHTYPERMWPRFAGTARSRAFEPNQGIRFEYGDLQDVVNLLGRSPLTRQAYLPIWFPEDTGAVHKQRVPCTLGYHFMIRDNLLSCRYYMRSCDLIRHFPDDVYLAARLMQWLANELWTCWNPWHDTAPGRAMDKMVCPDCPSTIKVSYLQMYIASLHAFAGDQKQLEGMANVTAK